MKHTDAGSAGGARSREVGTVPQFEDDNDTWRHWLGAFVCSSPGASTVCGKKVFLWSSGHNPYCLRLRVEVLELSPMHGRAEQERYRRSWSSTACPSPDECFACWSVVAGSTVFCMINSWRYTEAFRLHGDVLQALGSAVSTAKSPTSHGVGEG